MPLPEAPRLPATPATPSADTPAVPPTATAAAAAPPLARASAAPSDPPSDKEAPAPGRPSAAAAGSSGKAGDAAVNLADLPGPEGAPEDELADDPTRELLHGWRTSPGELSLQEVNGSIRVPGPNAKWYFKYLAFIGCGFMISVGYMDPGNWATDISAGSSYGYTLLCAILLSNLAAIFLQHLSLKLGVVSERDLAQACRDAYPFWVSMILWIFAEVAIAATDLAEVIGSATALNLLFGIPLWAGCLITVVDVMFILFFGTHSFRFLEIVVFCLCATIFGCFVYEVAAAKPNWGDVAAGLLPRAKILTNPDILYNAIGILGATVMPHNLFLHSSIIQTRAYPRTKEGKKMAVRWGSVDSTLSLMVAFLVNAAILIVAAAAFYYGPNPQGVEYIGQAFRLLAPTLGTQAAKILFGVALLAAGQNSTITGTLAGQVVMEGFLRIKLPPWVRRLVTRMVALIPAIIIVSIAGESGAGRLLVLSQVILSLTLTPSVVALVHFTSTRAKMGNFVNGWAKTIVGGLLAVIIGLLNGFLIIQSIKTNKFGSTEGV